MHIAKVLFLLFMPMYAFSQPVSVWNEAQFNNSNLSFRPSNNLFDGKTIVGLGEQTHNVVTTFEAKIKMVKYLHDSIGYNVLIFESGFYDCYKAYENLKHGDTSVSNIRKAIFGVWNTKEMDELYRYIISTQKTEKPLQLAGMDIQFIGHSRDSFMYEFGRLTQKLSKSTKKLHLDSNFAMSLYSEVSLSNFSKVPKSDTVLLSKNLHRMLDLLETVDSTDEYFSFWRRNVINSIFEYRKYYFKKQMIRDSLMADNVSWIVSKHKNEKFIIWSANTHLAKNTLGMSSKGYHIQFLGHHLQERFGSQYCFIPFTSNKGTIGIVAGIVKVRLKKTTNGSFEQFIADKYNCDFGLFPLNTPEIASAINKRSIYKSKIFWIKEEEMFLPDICDAVFYIKNMKPTRY